jgi:hypothetical protein
VKYDSGGVPHIAYQFFADHADENQLYARYVGDGTGNCGHGWATGDWQCSTVKGGEGYGMYGSLDLDADDQPSIAWYDGGSGSPEFAGYVGAGGNCGQYNDWVCRSLDQTGLDTGQYISLYVEDDGAPHIAYHNATNGTLEYATYVATGGNCGYNGTTFQWEWQCDEIEETGNSPSPMGVAIAKDGEGYPIIAYQDVSNPQAPAVLKTARAGAMDRGLEPNCGPKEPPLFENHTWSCQIIDGGGSQLHQAGSVSIAVNSAGIASVAYHELDDFAYPAKGNLKVAFQRLRIFLPLIVKGS